MVFFNPPPPPRHFPFSHTYKSWNVRSQKGTTIVPHDCIEIHCVCHTLLPPIAHGPAHFPQLEENRAIIKPTYFRLPTVLHVHVLLDEANECDNPLIDCMWSQEKISKKIPQKSHFSLSLSFFLFFCSFLFFCLFQETCFM